MKILWNKQKQVLEIYEENFDWDKVSSEYNLSEEFIEKYKDKINWNTISYFQVLSETFIKKHEKELNWPYLIMNKLFSEEFICKYFRFFTKTSLSKYCRLSEEFMDNYKYSLNWSLICQYQILSEEFMDAHIDFIDFDRILQHQKLSYGFINRNIKRINIRNLFSSPQHIPDNLFEKYKCIAMQSSRISYSQEYMISYIKEKTCFQFYDDYVIGYMSVCKTRYDTRTWQYKYEIGNVYKYGMNGRNIFSKCIADCNSTTFILVKVYYKHILDVNCINQYVNIGATQMFDVIICNQLEVLS